MRAYALTRAVLFTALLGAAAGTPAGADTRAVDYLYVEANEGDSSGGHVALRFGADTFHFQQEHGGLIRMRRDDAEIFAFRYAMVGNRAIHETRIAVSDETYARLRDTFTQRLLVQGEQFGRLEALQDDVDLFARRQSPLPDKAPTGVAVRGAGFFVDDAGTGDAGRSPAVAALAARVERTHGAGFIAARAAALRSGLAAWQPRAVREPAIPLTADGYPRYAPVASSLYREQLEAIAALDILAAAPALQQGSYRTLDDAPPLTPAEWYALEQFAEQLAAQLTALAGSTRGDFGYPLLLGMARLEAMERALSSGHLVVLDAFGADAIEAPLPDGPQRDAYLAAVGARLQPGLEKSRTEFFSQPVFREGDYTHLESAANSWMEALQARRGVALRVDRGLLIPSRAAPRPDLLAPATDPAGATAELEHARRALADQRARLRDIYGYNLITKNCVSEIFDTIEASLRDPSGDGEAASQAHLGGAVHTRFTLNFIPVFSAAAVERNYAAVAHRTRPSYRQLRVEALAAQEPAWRVYLRESNTLTSTVYYPVEGDSAFLFFTDDAVALRPLFGAANLLVGIGDSALGLFTWPADAGARLLDGLRGAVFSLPELAFVNLRKGSMAWAEPLPVTDAPSPRSWSSAP